MTDFAFAVVEPNVGRVWDADIEFGKIYILRMVMQSHIDSALLIGARMRHRVSHLISMCLPRLHAPSPNPVGTESLQCLPDCIVISLLQRIQSTLRNLFSSSIRKSIHIIPILIVGHTLIARDSCNSRARLVLHCRKDDFSTFIID